MGLVEQALELLGSVDGGLDEDPASRKAAARVVALAKAVEERVLAVLPELPLRPYSQVVPSPEAIHFVNLAKDASAVDSAKKQALIDRTADMLEKVLSTKISELRESGGVESDIRSKIRKFSVKYATNSGLDVNFVIGQFSARSGEFYVGLERQAIEAAFRDDVVKPFVRDPSTSVFRSGVLPSGHFEELISIKVVALVMDIERVWHSRGVERGENDQFLTELMNKAKRYIVDTFDSNFLGGELSRCNSLPELQEFARILPSDSNSYDLLRKSHFLLKVMHIILLHESEVDESSFVSNSRNLRAEMDDFCVGKNGVNRYINPPRTPDGTKAITDFADDVNGMPIDRCEVSTGKPLDSAIDKICRKGLYDTTEIADFARMRIFLRREDCYDERGEFDDKKVETALQKLWGILIARFGNDIDVESLSYSVGSGKTNESSMGAHKGIHFNFKYKSTSNANGLMPNGEPKTKAIDVEVQLLAYMSKDDELKDHDRYKEASKARLPKELGFDNTFDTFVLDLISALSNSQYKFEFESLTDAFSDVEGIDDDFRKVYDRQFGVGDKSLFPEDVDLEALIERRKVLFSKDKLRLFVLLLIILTKKDSEGKPANARIFDYMQRYFPGKLQRLITEYEGLLRGPDFQEGGKLSYLRRVLEVKMRFVSIILNHDGGTRSECRNCFAVSHVMRVGNMGGDGNPNFTLITKFVGGSGKPTSMELPYAGPIGLIGAERDVSLEDDSSVTKVFDFYWKTQSRGADIQRCPVYTIEHQKNGDAICYLCAATRDGVPAEKLPVWFFEPDSDRPAAKGKVYSYKYDIDRSAVSVPGHGKLKAEVDIENFKMINVSGLDKLTPLMGLRGKQAKFLKFVDAVGKGFDRERASIGKGTKSVKYAVKL
jgi:hypothetical protein